MAKNPKDPAITDHNLGDLPLELQVNATEGVIQAEAQTQPEKLPDVNIEKTTQTEPDNECASEEEVPEFVVLKGKTVQHDGVEYPENSVIYISGADAKRLLELGVIARLDDLKARFLSSNPEVV
ncbi:hypothetical protein [Xenorhabdus szentirmaii]|uniref:hypothetical protein n=1 Tax=Xenorhabdus szentirmaii TaxID=290112 RepID=UPI00198A1749|nr:hypothetical protein [Xenorhabdus sp. 38]MBD2781949.1 hypothetical protein [Xenorhabdus sp. 38]